MSADWALMGETIEKMAKLAQSEGHGLVVSFEFPAPKPSAPKTLSASLGSCENARAQTDTQALSGA